MVTRKSPKRIKRPYNSIKKPVKGHLNKIKIIPAVNAAVPFNFCGREKNAIVFWRPIIRVRPIRKRI